MSYQVVFDVSEQQFPWWMLAISLTLFAGGAIYCFAPDWTIRRLFGRQAVHRRLFGIAYLLVLSALMGPTIFQTWSTFNFVQGLICTGNYAVVEGTVQSFNPMPYGGGSVESFSVNGVLFEYTDYDARPGFKNTQSHGGPIRQGLSVRIYYTYMPQWRKNIILRLEIKQ